MSHSGSKRNREQQISDPPNKRRKICSSKSSLYPQLVNHHKPISELIILPCKIKKDLNDINIKTVSELASIDKRSLLESLVNLNILINPDYYLSQIISSLNKLSEYLKKGKRPFTAKHAWFDLGISFNAFNYCRYTKYISTGAFKNQRKKWIYKTTNDCIE
eukprot:UN06086